MRNLLPMTRRGSGPALVGLIVCAALAASGCAPRFKASTNSDPTANFGSYRTFGFAKPLGTDRPNYSSLLSQYLRDAATRELEARGYKPSDQPDLIVNFNVQTKDKINTTSVPTGPAYGGYYGYRTGYYGTWGGYQTQVTQYTQGTLTVDLVDASRKQLVWDGTVVGRVREEDRQNLQAVVNEVMTQIFAQYPYRVGPAPPP
jgi:hypothetical protein